jgi:reverse gyrase
MRIIFVTVLQNKFTAKMSIKTNEVRKFTGMYTAIARACGCSEKYVSMVLKDNLGKYKDRDTQLVKNIRQKAEELNTILN